MQELDPKKPLFDRLSVLDQSKEKKEEIAKIILDDARGDRLYWIEITLSTLIATFGLLQNSVAVIIGAMLIAPLIRPMQAMSFAISTGRSSFFWKSTFFLFKSVAISIGLALVFAFFIPLKAETPEIIARTAPNILDLFIAIFSAIIALLALSYQRLSESVAGVAMAASLMPPLAVVGIEIALGNWAAAWGSFLLFFVNFLAILLVGVVIFVLYGFTPHQEFQKKLSVQKIFTLLVIIVFTAIPLYSSLSNISEKIQTQQLANELLTEIIPRKIPESQLNTLRVKEVTDELITLEGEIQVPETIDVFESSYDSMLSELSPHFSKPIDIDFTLIRTAKISAPDIFSIEKQKILNQFETLFSKMFPSFRILQLSVQNSGTAQWEYKIIVSVPQGEFLTEANKKSFLFELQKQSDSPEHSIEWVAVSGSSKQPQTDPLTEEQVVQKDISKKISEFFTQPDMDNTSLKNLDIVLDTFGETDKESLNISLSIEYKTAFPTPAPLLLFNTAEKDAQNEENQQNSIDILLSKDDLQQKIEAFIQTLPYENIDITYRFFPYY